MFVEKQLIVKQLENPENALWQTISIIHYLHFMGEMVGTDVLGISTPRKNLLKLIVEGHSKYSTKNLHEAGNPPKNI